MSSVKSRIVDSYKSLLKDMVYIEHEGSLRLMDISQVNFDFAFMDVLVDRGVHHGYNLCKSSAAKYCSSSTRKHLNIGEFVILLLCSKDYVLRDINDTDSTLHNGCIGDVWRLVSNSVNSPNYPNRMLISEKLTGRNRSGFFKSTNTHVVTHNMPYIYCPQKLGS